MSTFIRTVGFTPYIMIAILQECSTTVELCFYSIWLNLTRKSSNNRCCIDSVCTHWTCSHGHGNASEEGKVVAGVHPMPHGWQQEGGSSGVDGAALIANPGERTNMTHIQCLVKTTQVETNERFHSRDFQPQFWKKKNALMDTCFHTTDWDISQKCLFL